MIIKANPQFAAFARHLQSLPQEFDKQGELLHDGRNKVRAMTWDGQRVIVKRYKKPNIFLKLQYAVLGTCKAMKAYRYGFLFNEAGLSSPAPVGYAIVGSSRNLKDSYFVSLPVTGVSLNDTLRGNDSSAIKRLAAELVKMHDAGLMHGDLNLTNIYSDADGSLHFIDTNRSKPIRKITQKACAENLMRLTSDPQLLSGIARAYAEIRNWEADSFASLTVSRQEAFKRKKAVLKSLKRLIGR